MFNNNKIIAIDALAISSRSAGSFTVLIGLLRELVKVRDYNYIIFTIKQDIENELGDLSGKIKYIYAPKWASKFAARIFWQQITMPALIKKIGCKLLYSASGYPLFFGGLAVISHQQNLWPFAESQSWWSAKVRIKSWLRKQTAKLAIMRSDANIYISEYLKNAAEQIVPSSKNKNFVVYNGISPELFYKTMAEPTKEQFCIAVSSLAIHKNYIALIDAFEKISKKLPELKLFIVGNYNNKYGRSVIDRCTNLRLENRIRFLGPQSLTNIVKLYKEALFSINVSLLEGFGLSVLESMAAGCPVICPNNTAFPEICGDAALYCDAKSIDDIAEKMIKVYSDRSLRTILIKEGLKRADNFKWNFSAEKLATIFELHLNP